MESSGKNAIVRNVMNLPEKLDGQYNPGDHEKRIQNKWQKEEYFNPDTQEEKGLVADDSDTFSMVLPPPNVTGTLHVGHAMGITNKDILARYHRMRGDKTLFLPGTDHAAIATQAKVERKLTESEGKDRFNLGREDFLQRVQEFAQDSHDQIVEQVRQIGASVDWSREAFTLDDGRKKAVRTAFKRMYEAGLIYRGDRVVNWDPKGQTTVSDDEVEHEEVEGTLWTFRYSENFPIAISTTRPETKFGDTAIAVHPDDERYQEYIGQQFETEFLGEKLTIEVIADKEIDPEYGSGAVGLTPAHASVDWEMARRHDLPLKQVINEDAEMMDAAGEFADQSTDAAREGVVTTLKDEGLIENEESVEKNVGRAERTGAVVEHLPKKQWFVDVKKKFEIQNSKIDNIEDGQKVTLKEIMETAVESGQISITPERFEKNYFHWIDNLRDWCISRQIWYGHRIPVYYCQDEAQSACTEPIVRTEAIDQCPHCSGPVHQDEDTLDTWFSSGLWTFSTLGWPDNTQDLKQFHPTDVLETGYDIIFFWVARMILMSGFLLEDVPFTDVYLHGMVKDEDGEKMSKSKGNVLDPADVIDEHGADALRFALVVGTTPGNDSNISEDKIDSYRRFANKIWNASKFVLMNIPEDYQHNRPDQIPDEYQTYLDQNNELINQTTEHIEKFQFNLAAEKIYEFFWHTFADEVIEATKDDLYDDNADPQDTKRARFVLYEILSSNLQLLHPFMPHLTETLWAELPTTEQMLCVSDWPDTDKS
jgi:valyl-tRNA synthetase